MMAVEAPAGVTEYSRHATAQRRSDPPRCARWRPTRRTPPQRRCCDHGDDDGDDITGRRSCRQRRDRQGDGGQPVSCGQRGPATPCSVIRPPPIVHDRPVSAAPGHPNDPDRQTPMLLGRTGTVATAVIAAAWAVIGALMLLRPVFISHDSLSNNVHVWFIADQLWSGHGIPMHVPALANGQALTFPARRSRDHRRPAVAAARHRAVTLWLVLRLRGHRPATFWTFPPCGGAGGPRRR